MGLFLSLGVRDAAWKGACLHTQLGPSAPHTEPTCKLRPHTMTDDNAVFCDLPLRTRQADSSKGGQSDPVRTLDQSTPASTLPIIHGPPQGLANKSLPPTWATAVMIFRLLYLFFNISVKWEDQRISLFSHGVVNSVRAVSLECGKNKPMLNLTSIIQQPNFMPGVLI